jgi:hypothetical protein
MVSADASASSIEIENSEAALINELASKTWISDISATVHMTNSLVGLCNIKYVTTEIKLGDGKCVSLPFYGKKHLKL